MKKSLTLSVLASMLLLNFAFADILPEGKTGVQVCSYFNNTAEFTDDLAIYGFETGPVLEKGELSQFIANECFTTSYKFNSYEVYAVKVADMTEDTTDYDPSTDEKAYPTNVQPITGVMYVDAPTDIERIENEYKIVGLDEENHVLTIQPVAYTTHYNDDKEALVTAGAVMMLDGQTDDGSTGEDIIPDDGTTPEEEAAGEDVFTDVSSESPYYDALVYLKEQGIIGGYPDGSFKPNNTINRAEFTKIIMGSVSTSEERAACYLDYSVEGSFMVTLFSDVELVAVGGNEPSWYFDYVCQAKKMDIIGGYPDGSFKPAQNINFVEGAKIVTSALFGAPVGTSTPWYKTYVMVLDEKNAIPTTINTFAHELTRGEMAEMVYRLKMEMETLASNSYDDIK